MRRPLVVMSPKSLLRHPLAVSSLDELANGTFLPAIGEVDELDPQALVNKMMEYGIFTEGTEVLDFNITGEDDNKTAVLNLNQAENNEGVSDNAFLVEIGNTFVENFELSKLTLQVNGKDLAGAADLSYEADYENVD